MNTELFEPVSLGALNLSNRIVMAPLTRSRADFVGVPHPAAALYYAQRASAGMIVSEGVCISPQAVGNPRVPGIWNEEQVTAWKAITDAVHSAGGTIVAQLWHTGRASHPSLQPNGQLHVGPSAVAITGSTFARHGITDHVCPRALSIEEITGIVGDYARAANNAKLAGFDGVELHGANGYLIDQFVQDNANLRDDAYGGDVANRSRLLEEVLTALTGQVGADRVGVRISPSSAFQDMNDSDPEALFAHVLERISNLNLAYLHVVEPGISGASTAERLADSIDSSWIRDRYDGRIVAAGNYHAESAAAAVNSGVADAVAFGRAFLANPDLPSRLASSSPLNEADQATFYSGELVGYIDYPSLEAQRLLDDIQAGRRSATGATLSERTNFNSWELTWACERARRTTS